MKNLKEILRNELMNVINEQDKPKKNDIMVPEGCFGGPKTHIGGLISLIELLMKENDREGRLAVEDMKQFFKGVAKPDPKVVVQILRKHNKPQFIKFAGCI